MDINTALGTSIMAFILGMLIGVSLGYVLWAEKDRQKGILYRKTSDDRLYVLENGPYAVHRKATDDRLDTLENDSVAEQERRAGDESE